MTVDDALHTVEHPSNAGDKTYLLVVYLPAAKRLAAEVRALRQRLDLVSPCPTCGTLTAAASIDVNGQCLACHLRRHR